MTAMRRFVTGLLVLGMMAALCLPMQAQQADPKLLETPAAQLYSDAIFQFRYGDRDLGMEKFRQFMKTNPSPELAKALVVRYGDRPVEQLAGEASLKGLVDRFRQKIRQYEKAGEAERRMTDAEAALGDALVNFRIGEYGRALEAMNRFETYKLSPQELFHLRREVGSARLRQMAGGRFGQELPEGQREDVNKLAEMTRDMLMKSARYAESLKTDRAHLEKMVEMLKTEAGAREVADDLVAAGEFAVPPIVERLKTVTDKTLSARYEGALKGLGDAAVMPLIEVMDADDVELKVKVAEVLRVVGDLRVVPVLKRVIENPEADAGLRAVVREALKQVTGDRVDRVPGAPRAYFDLAERYYYDRSEVSPTAFEKSAPVWKLVGGQLVHEMVPVEQYGVVYAERFARDGMALQDRGVPLAELLVAVQARQMLLRGQVPGSGAAMPVQTLLALGGLDLLGRAMVRPVRDGDSDVVLTMLSIVRQVVDGDPASLERVSRWEAMAGALASDDPLVSMATAGILAGNVGRGRFALAPATTMWMDRALWQATPTRHVLVAGPDNARVNVIRDLLRKRKQPVQVETFRGLGEALLRSTAAPVPDLVILDARLLDETVEPVAAPAGPAGARLPAPRRAWFTMPVVVMAEPQAVARYKKGAGTTYLDVVSYTPDAKMLDRVVEPALALTKPTFRLGYTSVSVAMAVAEQLSALRDPGRQVVARTLLTTVNGAVEQVPPTVALELVHFMGEMASADSLPPLRRIALDGKRKMPLRVAALRGIAAVLSSTRSDDPQVYAELLKLVKGNNRKLAFEAAAALGKGGYGPDQMTGLMLEMTGSE